MQLEQGFALPAPPEAAWPLLRDVAGPRVRLIDSALTTAEFAAEREHGFAITPPGVAQLRVVREPRFFEGGERVGREHLGPLVRVVPRRVAAREDV